MNILEKIFDICEKKTGFMPRSANTNLRFREMVLARNLYFKLARQYTSFSLTQIGIIVNRDHSTVLHGLKTIENDINQYPEIRQLCTDAENCIIDLLRSSNVTKVDECILILKRLIEGNNKLLNDFESIRKELLINENYDNEKLSKTA